MHVAPKIHRADFSQYLSRLNVSNIVSTLQITRLAKNVVHNLPFIDTTCMALLKAISQKIENQSFIESDYEDRICARINNLASSIFNDMEIRYIPDYPYDIIKMIADRTALEMLYRERDKLGDTTQQLQIIQKQLDVLNIRSENCLPNGTIGSYLKRHKELVDQQAKYIRISETAAFKLVFLAIKSGNFLRELSLPIDLSEEAIEIILTNCPHIEKINLRQGGCEDVPLGKISLLKHLKILELPFQTPFHKFDFNTIPTLEELSLDCRNQNFLNLSQLVKLKKLHLTVDHDDLLKIMNSNHEIFTPLEDLTLEITQNEWGTQNLYLQNLTGVAKLTSLKHLSITCLMYAQNHLSDNALHVLASCQSLETLHFDCVIDITQEGIEHLVSSLPKLKTLRLEFTANPEVEFKKLQTKFPTLDLFYSAHMP